MTTHLLAEKNGWISIIGVQQTTDSYIVFKFAFEKKVHKKFIKERGRVWELFSDIDEARRWINE